MEPPAIERTITWSELRALLKAIFERLVARSDNSRLLTDDEVAHWRNRCAAVCPHWNDAAITFSNFMHSPVVSTAPSHVIIDVSQLNLTTL